jgi:hypothetical protein
MRGPRDNHEVSFHRDAVDRQAQVNEQIPNGTAREAPFRSVHDHVDEAEAAPARGRPLRLPVRGRSATAHFFAAVAAAEADAAARAAR